MSPAADEGETRDAKTLYQEVIVAHGKAPRHEGPLDGATHEARVVNPLCGDRITLHLRVDPTTQAIAAASFEARGCMIAKASASMLTDAVVGLPRADALALVPFVEDAVGASVGGERAAPLPPAAASRADVLAPLRGARDFPARRACVLLVWRALHDCLVTASVPTSSSA